MLDLAILHMDLMLLAQIPLELLHVPAVDREQGDCPEAVGVGGRMQPETWNVRASDIQ